MRRPRPANEGFHPHTVDIVGRFGGIVSLQDHETITLDQLIERADKSMYMAKQKRNCLAYWDDGEARPYLIE